MKFYEFFFYYLPWILLLTISIFLIIAELNTRRTRKRAMTQELKTIEILEEHNKAFASTSALNSIILQTLNFNLVTQRIANAIPRFLGYQTGVLAIIDEAKGILKRVAISETSGGIAALKSLEVPFNEIEINLSEKENYCIKSLFENKVYSTTKLYDVLQPAISKENAEKVQKMMGTKTTLIYPIYSLSRRPLGTFLVSMDKYEKDLTEFERQTISNFVDGVRIALVNANLYTSLQKTTHQLQIANQKLKELDKLKDEFVSLASHELKTPMTIIKSYIWMALDKKKLPKDIKKYLEKAKCATDRLINLVNNMLNTSKIESGRISLQLSQVNLMELGKEIAEEIAPKIKELDLNFKIIETEIPEVFCDKEKVREIFLNLIGNAMKFTPAKGKISLNFKVEKPFVLATVSDTGKGIASEDICKLFTKFGRLQNSYSAMTEIKGTGLGLYISKSIINLHKGAIEVKSEGPDKGCQFTFSLPIVGSEPAKQLEKDTPKEEIKYETNLTP